MCFRVRRGTVAARQGDSELFTWIWDRVNQSYMRVPWRVMEKVKHYYANDETFIWDKVNKCEMKVPWNVFMEVSTASCRCCGCGCVGLMT